MIYRAQRLQAVLPSASAGVSQTARVLKSQGHDVIDLGLGEPDFATPAHIIEAAHAAALDGQTRYPPTDGTAELKAAIVAKLKRDNTVHYAAPEVIVCNGAKQVIFNALMASAEPGQRVLLCAPYFDSYQNIALVQGLNPVVIPCSPDNDFRLTPQLLREYLTSETRWLMLNSPSNPAGVVYTRTELEALAEVLLLYPETLILCDEIYEKILFDHNEAVSLAAVCPELKHRILTVNGVSKAYAMTGWRIGYGAGPQDLIAAMTTVQSQISSGACSVAQAAAVEALNGPQQHVVECCDIFQRRRNLVVRRIEAIERLQLSSPAGAFYALIGCAELQGMVTPQGGVINSETDFVQHLLQNYQVAAVPGTAYGVESFFRISTATSDEKLSTALDRLSQCVAELR
jgi:aspartate aminotransferase